MLVETDKISLEIASLIDRIILNRICDDSRAEGNHINEIMRF